MQICDKCGTLMVPTRGKTKVFLLCRKCGKKKSVERVGVAKISEKIEKTVSDYIPVLEGEDETLPKTRVICPECGNNRAFWWMKQTRSSDEPETRFYRCTECKYTWREYS